MDEQSEGTKVAELTAEIVAAYVSCHNVRVPELPGLINAVLAVVLGVRLARQGIPASLTLPAFLQSYISNSVTAGVRLIPLGQTDGQLAIAELEEAVLAASAQAKSATIDDLGSAAFMVDLASMAHETQYTRLFRS
jgi:urease accessory protein